MFGVGRVGYVGQQYGAGIAGGGGGPTPSFSSDFTQGTMPAGYTTQRSTDGSYYNSAGVFTIAPPNTNRLDYDPITLQPRGLLQESVATNFLLNSMAPVTQIANNGANLAVGTYVAWGWGSGTITTSAGTAVGTGFGVANAGATNTFGTPNVFTISTAGTVNVTVAGTVNAFQLEQGSFPSSLIVTTATTATRGGDLVTMPIGGWFNPSEGTLMCEADTMGSALNRVFCEFDDGSNNNAINLLLTASNSIGVVRVAGTAQAAINLPTPALYTTFKLALAYKLNDTNSAYNGTLGTLDTACTIPTGITTMRLSGRLNDQFLNGHIRKFSYYNSRLTDAALPGLTL